MKKKIINPNSDLLSKFQQSEVAALSTIQGGTVVPPQNSLTLDYTTSSSADDADTGDHDSDAS